MPMMHRDSQQGFTLVVIAALFVAFAVIAAVAVERNTTVQQITRRDAANEQLTRLSNAIIEYSVFHKSGTVLIYPCPAATNLAVTNASFGAMTVGCDAANPAGTTSVPTNLAADSVIIGMVPVRDLAAYGIGVNDAFDPWNNRIMYIVNRKLTTGSPVLATEQANNPILTDPRTGYAPNTPPVPDNLIQPDFILLSYGRDGVGAIKRANTAISIACTNGTATLRYENCDNDVNFYIAPTNTSANTTSATYFDDILTYFRQ